MENLIKKYLDKHEMSQSEFARRVGMSRQLLHNHFKNPKIKWNPKTAVGIERATSGEILAYDLVFKD